jgi:hypothetical protein
LEERLAQMETKLKKSGNATASDDEDNRDSVSPIRRRSPLESYRNPCKYYQKN